MTTINNKKMDEYIVENVDGRFIYRLPTLSTINKNDKKMFWKIWSDKNEIFRQSYHLNGKVRDFPSIICTGKNVGKKNETTDNQQAMLEAYSKWSKQQDKGYSIHIEEKEDKKGECIDNEIEKDKQKMEMKKQEKDTPILPMLAQKFDERAKYIQYPAGVSRKLDGIRMFARDVDGVINLTSRMYKEFKWMSKIREQIKMINDDKVIFDGELYSHTIPFNAISGSVRKKNEPSVYDDQLEYWVFDLAVEGMTYLERVTKMKDMEKKYERLFKKEERRLIFVYYDMVDSAEDIQKYHDKYVAEGYEGLMIRNFDGKYRFKHRSNDLQKYKNFEDTEFEIVGYKLGTVTEEGAIVFLVKDNNSDQTFDVRPRGTIEKRIEWGKRGEEFVGKMLNVRYQKTGIDDGSLPRFPVGIYIRDFE